MFFGPLNMILFFHGHRLEGWYFFLTRSKA